MKNPARTLLKKRNVLLLIAVLIPLVILSFLPSVMPTSAVLDEKDLAKACRDLVALRLPDTTIRSAEIVPAGKLDLSGIQGEGVEGDYSQLPVFCRVIGVVAPAIHFEVWLPTENWNGRFNVVGNGGLAGSIRYVAMAPPLMKGFAVAATDAGHKGSSPADGTWALGNPHLVADYGHRAIHETTVKGKAILEAFYGKPADYSYFVGCSIGGRQGIIEATRYPEDFDGVVSGAPGLAFVEAAAHNVYAAQAVLDEDSKLSPELLVKITDAVLELYDELDGVKDRIINEPDKIAFDPELIRDKVGLNDQQVEALRKIYRGPYNSAGERIYPGYALGSEYTWWLLTGDMAPVYKDIWAYMIKEDPNWDWRTLNLDDDVALGFEKLKDTMGFDNPDFTKFHERGGKIIIYHGWNENQTNPFRTIEYYNEIAEFMGGLAEIQAFSRLYLIPGMEHCGGGEGTDTFDMLVEVMKWVEEGKAPDKVTASKVVDGKVVRTRPLCPYPQVAQYTGRGSPDVAENFVCKPGSVYPVNKVRPKDKP